jgi:CheY-like chemotaxis protein
LRRSTEGNERNKWPLANRSEQQPGGSRVAKRLILIVEDDADIVPALLQIITTEDHSQAVFVREGVQALSLVELLTPELLVLDDHLPCLTGIDLYDRLQAQSGLKHVPVILMSANLHASEAASARGIPYLKKPFKLAALFTLMDALLGE